MSADDVSFPVDALHVIPWSDPVIDRVGHDPRSIYVERFWLGILGPSTTWLLRTIAARLEEEPAGFRLDVRETARALGLGVRGGRHSPILRAIARGCQFGLARELAPDELAVRQRIPPLTRRQVERLPDSLRVAHESWHEQPPTPVGAPQLRERARRLALTLVELGEGYDATERQLHRWRFHPALAHEAATWAWREHHGADAEVDRRPGDTSSAPSLAPAQGPGTPPTAA